MTENFWDKLMETDEGAANYMASYGEGPNFETRHIVSSFVNADETVLDVGCGPGWNYEHFMEFGPHIKDYLGLDYSARFVRVANQRVGYPQDVSQHKKFLVGDARDLKQLDESWDVVILQDCLEHINGYEKPVREALRVARKRIIISFWHLEGNEGTEHINEDGDDGWGAWYDKEKWEAFLNTLPYVWHELDVAPEGKNHKWHFYIITKEAEVA